MSMRRLCVTAILVCLGASATLSAEGPHLGEPISKDDLAAWQRNVFPDGTGLPDGRGNAREGRDLYKAKCAGCHGPGGRGYTAEELAGSSEPLTSAEPAKTIGTYWPYATTIFDFVRRAMPMNAPGSLTADETYAITAYLLFENKIIAEDFDINARSLPLVKMPNRDGFDLIEGK